MNSNASTSIRSLKLQNYCRFKAFAINFGAHPSARLNPYFGEEACRRSPGIVLIDEVDMYLHPAWQQTVVASLREAFPAISAANLDQLGPLGGA